MVGCHAVAAEPVDGDVLEELRIQVETPFREPETVEHHSLDGISAGEGVLPRLGNGTIDDRGDDEGIVGTGDDVEIADGEDRDVIESVDEGG